MHATTGLWFGKLIHSIVEANKRKKERDTSLRPCLHVDFIFVQAPFPRPEIFPCPMFTRRNGSPCSASRKKDTVSKMLSSKQTEEGGKKAGAQRDRRRNLTKATEGAYVGGLNSLFFLLRIPFMRTNRRNKHLGWPRAHVLSLCTSGHKEEEKEERSKEPESNVPQHVIDSS